MPKTIWDKQTGEARVYDFVDAKEILEKLGDRYTDVKPKNGKDAPAARKEASAEGDGVRSTPDFASMAIADLKRYAAEKGIDLEGASKKGEILQRVRTPAPAPTSPSEGEVQPESNPAGA